MIDKAYKILGFHTVFSDILSVTYPPPPFSALLSHHFPHLCLPSHYPLFSPSHQFLSVNQASKLIILIGFHPSPEESWCPTSSACELWDPSCWRWIIAALPRSVLQATWACSNSLYLTLLPSPQLNRCRKTSMSNKGHGLKGLSSDGRLYNTMPALVK